MSQSIPLSQLESSPAAQFTNVGDKYAGRIVNMEERVQTDPKTGQVQTFKDGAPRMQWVITIQQADGSNIALYAKGGKYKIGSGQGESMLSAIGSAVRKAGAASVDVGGELAVAHSGLGEQTPGLNAAKLYVAEYRPPAPASASVPVDLFSQ